MSITQCRIGHFVFFVSKKVSTDQEEITLFYSSGPLESFLPWTMLLERRRCFDLTFYLIQMTPFLPRVPIQNFQ